MLSDDCQSTKLFFIYWAAAHLAGHKTRKSWRCRCQPPHPPCCDPSVPRQLLDPDAWGPAQPDHSSAAGVCRRRPRHLPAPKGLRGRRHCCPAACDLGIGACRDRLLNGTCCKPTSDACAGSGELHVQFHDKQMQVHLSKRCIVAIVCSLQSESKQHQPPLHGQKHRQPTFTSELQWIDIHKVRAQPSTEHLSSCLPLATIM
jgi:hypothetical protein